MVNLGDAQCSQVRLNGADVLESLAYARACNTYHRSGLLQEAALLMVESRHVQF